MDEKPKTDIRELFRDAKRRKTYLKVCAPMVRYSKLPFRTLVKQYGVDLCFTPMIMTDSFSQSEKARQNEFSTNRDDTPLIAQFAANNIHEYLSSVEMVYPYVDGVDLNCGCPQRWAMQSGFGSALLNKPELIQDFTSTIRRNVSESFSVSVKVRVQKPLSKTIDLCRQLEKCGVTFLTVHGRTPTQKIQEPSNSDFLREIKQSLSIPLIANGDCKSLEDADNLFEKIQCDGVMSARGILANPTLFSGRFESTPLECVQKWMNIGVAADDNLTFQCFHHHFTFMMEKYMRRRDRALFNGFTRREQVLQYMDERHGIRPEPIDVVDNWDCTYDESKYRQRMKDIDSLERKAVSDYNADNSRGKFFQSKMDGGSDGGGDSDGTDDDDDSDSGDMNTGSLFDEI